MNRASIGMPHVNRARFPVDPWALVEVSPDAQEPGLTETLFAVGNGYLGLRGNHPEGRSEHEHGTFVNGFHETWPIRHAEEAYGFAKVGQTIINAPDAKVLRVLIDDRPLSLDTDEIEEYRRTLDFRTGVLRRSLIWRTPTGLRVRLIDDRMVSLTDRHLAVMQLSVEVLNGDAPVTIVSQMINRQDGEDVYGPRSTRSEGAGFDPRKTERIADRVLIPEDHWARGERTALSYRTASSGMSIAVVADHAIDATGEVTVRASAEPDATRYEWRVTARAGEPVTVTKLVAVHTSRGVPTTELLSRGEVTLDRAREEGVARLHATQREWLDRFWDAADVRIGDHDDLQQATRWCLFQLLQATARADGRGVPAKGLTGSGYSGHYFWDTEIYVLPFLMYTMPQLARNALRMRSLMLPAARRRAAALNEAGALFPWRTINGEEASAYYAAGTAQYHINADVTFALAKYVRATGDLDFLAKEGAEVAVETARMWQTLGFWHTVDGVDTFHIHGVTGPDEYTTVVNDNLYTNVMARFNLRFAVRSMEILAERYPDDYARIVEHLGIAEDEADEWRRAADALHIPYSPALGIHPQDSQFLDRELWDLDATPANHRPLLLHYHPLVIYRFQVLKQADVVLALFLQGNHFTPEEKLADFEYYDPLTTGDSTLSAVVQSILAAEVGYQGLAADYFRDALFVDLADTHHNTSDGVHVASAGGVWTALVCGFGGMRDYLGELSFDPRLPHDWPSLDFSLLWHGVRLRVHLVADAIRFEAEDERPDGGENPGSVTLSVRGEQVTVTVGEPVTVALADQGPSLPGRPTVRHLTGLTLEDGSVLTSSVPSTTTELSPLADSGYDAVFPEGAQP